MWLSDQVVSHLRDVASWPDLPEGRYRVLRPIGQGGMGRVYEARDERLDRVVAIKVSNAPFAGSSLDARLEREALVSATLEHPGIVPVHDVGVLDDGRLFYVMKLVRGVTLEQHAATLTSESARLSVFERVVEPIAFAHARGIVHRDVKPSNVMVGPFGEVLVLDWGAAKRLDDPDAHSQPAAVTGETSIAPNGATTPGTRMGTPGFMAPEQAEGRVGDVSPASDVYALGALLFWLLSGDMPSAEPGAAGRAPADRLPDVPKRLRAIVARCLAERAEDRYTHAGEVAADVARYRAGDAVIACPETAWDRFGRWFVKYRTFVGLIAAYLVMRALVAWWRW